MPMNFVSMIIFLQEMKRNILPRFFSIFDNKGAVRGQSPLSYACSRASVFVVISHTSVGP